MQFWAICYEPDSNGDFLITSPDFPEVSTYAEDKGEISKRGREAIAEAIAARNAAGEPLPVQPKEVMTVVVYDAE